MHSNITYSGCTCSCWRSSKGRSLNNWTSACPKKAFRERWILFGFNHLHVLLLTFLTPFTYQWPIGYLAGYASASSKVFTHCSETPVPIETHSDFLFLNVWLNVTKKEGLLQGHNLTGD